MQRPRHPYLPALAILLIAGVLGACGVKGELERPAAAVAPSSASGESGEEVAAAPKGAPGPHASAKRIFYESSSIKSVSPHDEVLPKMPPREWEKKKEVQPARGARTARPGPHQVKPDPDKAFLLDWLL